MQWVQVSNRAAVIVPPAMRWDAVKVPRVNVWPATRDAMSPAPCAAACAAPRARFLCDLALPIETPEPVRRQLALQLHML
jgi:hypothetical protein